MSLTHPSRNEAEPPARAQAPETYPVLAYVVTRTDRGVQCWTYREHDVRSPLPHLMRHSPSGFEVGYQGGGPTDLARSILGDHLRDENPSPLYYYPFRDHFLALPSARDGCTIEVGEIETWLKRRREELKPERVS